MDELRMIAAMLDGPPAPDTRASDRARLVNGTREPERPARCAWRRPGLWSGFGLAATAATVAGVVTLGSGTASAAAAAAAAAEPMSAKTVLLTAAEQAETASATGKYWHVRTLQTRAFRVLRNGHDYWLVRQVVTERWTSPDGRNRIGSRGLDAVPMSAKDRADWRQDGKPKLRLPARLDEEPGAKTFLVCAEGMTFKQVQALPTDPVALEKTLTRSIPREKPSPTALTADQVLRGCLTDLLSFLPTPPKVRATAYRMLAAMPGVTIGGSVTDERGRKGVELRARDRGGMSETVIIDPGSSLVLATSRTIPGVPGTASGELYLQTGWTDSEPDVPALP